MPRYGRRGTRWAFGGYLRVDEAVRQGIASFVLAATAPFSLSFAASVAAFAWPGEATPQFIWRGLLLGGSYVLGAVVMIMAMTHFSLVDSAEQEISPDALQALNFLDGNFWVAADAALGVMMLGAAGWLLGRIGIYNVLGWAALVLGIALFIPLADFFALLLSLVWIIVASIALYRERREDRVVEAAVIYARLFVRLQQKKATTPRHRGPMTPPAEPGRFAPPV